MYVFAEISELILNTVQPRAEVIRVFSLVNSMCDLARCFPRTFLRYIPRPKSSRLVFTPFGLVWVQDASGLSGCQGVEYAVSSVNGLDKFSL